MGPKTTEQAGMSTRFSSPLTHPPAVLLTHALRSSQDAERYRQAMDAVYIDLLARVIASHKASLLGQVQGVCSLLIADFLALLFLLAISPVALFSIAVWPFEP